jgi:pyrroline-5-carboxylate reductase
VADRGADAPHVREARAGGGQEQQLTDARGGGRRVAIIGAGRLGESLLRGFLSSDWRSPDELTATSRRAERLAELRERYGVRAISDNSEAVRGAPLVIVSVKPQDMGAVLRAIGGALTPDQTLLSVAAGVTTRSLEEHLPVGSRVVRAMPNAPALVHEGIAGICGGDHARDDDLELATEALGHLGGVVRVAEPEMDAVTALSGSGPAYFALLAEAMIEAGLLLGLSREISTRLVVQTMFGSAMLLRDEGIHPVELREAVTSPGGTTTRAIRELERSGVRAAFLNAINAATERSRELAARVDET